MNNKYVLHQYVRFSPDDYHEIVETCSEYEIIKHCLLIISLC
jgi:hypothetical protein